jgi:two-component system CheB/CheR fusion protein
MKNAKPTTEDVELRRLAEKKLQGCNPGEASRTVEDERRLLQELEVHQVELEMQNEELRRSRLEVEEGLNRYTELFDFAPVGYATVSLDGIIRDVNHRGARLLGKNRSALIGENFHDFVAAARKEDFSALLGQAISSDRPESRPSNLTQPSGESLEVHMAVSKPLRAEAVALVTFEDISGRVAKEAELAVAHSDLRDSSQRKDEFLAVLSHEIRNPLAPIRSSLFILGRAQPGSDQARRALAVIDRQVVHLTRLIDDLLDVTRIERGKILLRRERVELGDLVRRTMEDHRSSFESGGVHLEGRFEPGLFWIYADAARLVQVVSNLLGNAEKFTPRGGSVVVSLNRDGVKVVLSVCDTGLGIHPEMMRHMFEPFVQSPQTVDRARGGLGLGLAMVKGLVELHGGTVDAMSAGLGSGAELKVSLPLAAEPAPGPAVRSRAEKNRILVIEDNTDSANSLVEALQLLGHEVCAAYSGLLGIELARSFQPEIVICDIGLPEMDGYQVARALRSERGLAGAYLIALSGYAQPEDLQRATEAGFNQHVAKPVGLDELERVIGGAPAFGGER